MGFLAPAAFALAALIPIVIAMYLLKLRRTEQVVSSVYLWRRMVRDVQANAPWQRLRRNLLLILQLLFLAALILALVRPFTWAAGTGSQALILILDTSASMAATDVPPTRLEAAKSGARQWVDGLPDQARVTVITAGDGAQVLAASSQDRRHVHQAIGKIQGGAGNGDLTSALELASAIAARQPETEIVVFSDGRARLPERLVVEGHLRYVPIGQSGDNQAISLLTVDPPSGAGGPTAFAQVTNYGAAPARRRLALYADGELVNAYDIEIAPGGQKAVVADNLPTGARIVEAQLGGQDALPLDDRAWAVSRTPQLAPVTLVTQGNLFLETALALLPGLQVTTLPISQSTPARMAQPGRANLPNSQSSVLPSFHPSILTILDAHVPLTATLPAGNLLFIAPPSSTSLFTVTGSIEQPLLRPVDAEDPLLAHVDLGDVSVLDAARIALPAWARPVIAGDLAGDTTPLLFAGETDGRRVAVLAFDLHRSDLPLQVAFPLLLANMIGWLAPGGGDDLPTQVAPGAAVTLPLPPQVESLVVTRPDGSTARLIPEGGQAMFADTTQLGVYTVEWDQTVQVRFAVNLFSPQESDVEPAQTLPLAGDEAVGEGERPQQSRREWWRPLALAGLALLTAEWLVYQRATLSRLWGGVRQARVRKRET